MLPEVPDGTRSGLSPEEAAPWPAPRPREPIGPEGPPAPWRTTVPEPGHAQAADRATPRARRFRPRTAVLLAVLTAGVIGFGAGVTGVIAQVTPRGFSASQRRQITAWEIGKRWRTWPAGEIFPATVPYRLSSTELDGAAGLEFTAHRVGIAPQARCAAATDPSVAHVLTRNGCVAVLRATYEDATQALAVTVGVAVLPGDSAARASARALPAGHAFVPGVRVVSFRRTVVAGFGDRDRQVAWHRSAGPYLVLATVGYADGRRRARAATDPYTRGEMLSLAEGVGQWVVSHLGAAPPPPRCPGSPAC